MIKTEWETRLGFKINADLMLELEGVRAATDDSPLYVYLCSGAVDEIYPATAVSVTDGNVVVMYEEAAVASYTRNDVLFCSKIRVSPFPI